MQELITRASLFRRSCRGLAGVGGALQRDFSLKAGPGKQVGARQGGTGASPKEEAEEKS